MEVNALQQMLSRLKQVQEDLQTAGEFRRRWKLPLAAAWSP